MSSFEGLDPSLFEFDSEVSIDCGNCASCPKVRKIMSEIGTLADTKEELINQVTNPKFEKFIEGDFQIAVESGYVMGVEQASGEKISDSHKLAEVVRRMAAGQISDTEAGISDLKDEVGFLSLGCSGSLVILGHLAGRSVVATICNSPQLLNGESIEHVVVDRSGSIED